MGPLDFHLEWKGAISDGGPACGELMVWMTTADGSFGERGRRPSAVLERGVAETATLKPGRLGSVSSRGSSPCLVFLFLSVAPSPLLSLCFTPSPSPGGVPSRSSFWDRCQL